MRIAIVQGNYIPWIGYFALINAVDKFVVYEDVQYTKNDYRNRNWLLRNDLKLWLTIPVAHESLAQRYPTIKVADERWARKHMLTLRQHLSRGSAWHSVEPVLRECYERAAGCSHLYEINRIFITTICKMLAVRTEMVFLDSFEQAETPSKRVANIVEFCGGTTYLSGPAAQSYLQEEDFHEKGIAVEWCDYGHIVNAMLCSRNDVEDAVQRKQSVVYDLAHREFGRTQ